MEWVVVDKLMINDAGGSIVLHTFGAYFGLACSLVLQRKSQREHPNEGSIYHSDQFAMIGSIFLWRKFDMVTIANSTLAGGVAIGTIANVILEPVYAILIGFIAGIVSVLGYKFLTPFLTERIGLHDTCGVHNLHGMPGLIAGIVSVIAATHQLAAIFIILGASLLSGALTSLFLRLKFWRQLDDEAHYSDAEFFEIPDDFERVTATARE
ncbi:unnamed protein product, partial [Mesorhabditis spiculigera]